MNGSEIGIDEFARDLFRAESLVLGADRPLSAPQVTRLGTEVLEGLVRRELFYQESRKMVRVTDEEITAELEKLEGQFQSPSDFVTASPALRPQLERAISIRKYIDTVYTLKAQVTDKEIRSYYDRNRDSFRRPEQVRASHIFVKVDPSWDEAKKREARKKIDDIRRRALAGEDFAALAHTGSEDTTAPQGGDMGYVRQGQLLKPVEDALFVLKPKETSDVIETRVGYHIVRAVERIPETTVPFENVKDRLRSLLKQEKEQQEANVAIAKVREKANVEIFLPPEE